jgi:hypothetical protein
MSVTSSDQVKSLGIDNTVLKLSLAGHCFSACRWPICHFVFATKNSYIMPESENLFKDAGNDVVVVRLGDLGAVEGAGDEDLVGAEVVDEDFAVDLRRLI